MTSKPFHDLGTPMPSPEDAMTAASAEAPPPQEQHAPGELRVVGPRALPAEKRAATTGKLPTLSQSAPIFEQFEVWKKGGASEPDMYLGVYPHHDLTRAGGELHEFVRQRVVPQGAGSGLYFMVLSDATGKKVATSPVKVWGSPTHDRHAVARAVLPELVRAHRTKLAKGKRTPAALAEEAYEFADALLAAARSRS